MIAVVERDRRVARRLAAALEAQGCRARVAHGYRQAKALLAEEVPKALYVSEALQRASGGDLLADLDGDERMAAVPALVRVSRMDSVFARALRHGGLKTIVAPVDVELAATTLVRMSRGEEGTLKRLIHHARTLHARTKAERERSAILMERARRVRARPRRE